MLIRHCPRVKTLIATHKISRAERLYPIRCKCWTCPFCYRKNLGALIRQIEAAPPDRFITLTCKRHLLETPLSAYARHRPAIRRLFELARQRFGKQEYAVFCELHKSGYPHWHILQRGSFIPQRWLSDTWAKLTGSMIVDIRRCGNAREAARYVTKYVTKSATMTRLDPRYRIVTFSKHFRPPREKNRLAKDWSLEFSFFHPETVAANTFKNWTAVWQGEYYALHRPARYIGNTDQTAPWPDPNYEPVQP